MVLTSSAVLLTIFASGCGSSSAKSEKISVVAGFYPLAFAAEQVGGEHVEVRNLTPPGAEPHDLEVSPRDVERVRSAALVFLVGDGFQPQIERAAGRRRGVVRVLDAAPAGGVAHGDPHVWLDPVRYAAIVRLMGVALGAPARADRLIARLHRLDRELQTGLGHCRRREIVTSHRAFVYLARRYRLRQIAITGLSPEAEPAPRDLGRVVALVRRSRATTVFFETLITPRLAETVARESGAQTATLNPIEGLTAAESRRGEDYFSLMRANLRTLRQALACR